MLSKEKITEILNLIIQGTGRYCIGKNRFIGYSTKHGYTLKRYTSNFHFLGSWSIPESLVIKLIGEV